MNARRALAGALSLRATVVVAFLLLLGVKVIAAGGTDLFGDEAFYWQCSQRPDLAYADHPFVTALLVRLGTDLLGDTPLGVRLWFLVMGAAVPLAVFLLARPLAGARDAWLAMGISMVLPGLAGMGVVAVPDAPLLAFSSFALVAFERATRLQQPGAWLLCGLLCALGLATHYRFALWPLAALLYLVATSNGRACWKRPPFYAALLVASLGMIPFALFNLRVDFAPLRFQALDRHEGGFALEGPGFFVLEQAAIVSPLLFVALLGMLFALVRRARAGNDRAVLLALFAGVFIGTYALTSPWSDRQHAHMHWPLPGYVPLLVYVPALLRGFVQRGAGAWPRRALAAAVPGVGALALLLVVLDLATGLLGFEFLHRPFAGWSKLRQRTELLLDHRYDSSPPVLVADHFIVAAQLEFAFGNRADVYVLDHLKNRQYGRALQYDLWDRGERGLKKRQGEDALVVLDEGALPSAERAAWRAHVASLFEEVDSVARLEAYEARKHFVYLTGRRIRGPERDGDGDGNHQAQR